MQNAAAQAIQEHLPNISSEQAIEALKSQSAQIGTEMLEWLKHSAEGAGNFVVEQVPLYIQEFFAWNFARCAILSVALGVGFFVLLIAAIFVTRKFWKAILDGSEPVVLIPIFALVAALFAGYNSLSYGMEAVKIKIAPRVYLVDYLADTVHKKENPGR